MFNCIFHQDWWLEAVAPGRWGAVEVKRGERVAARLPYVEKRRLGMKVLTMPPLTQFLGPWVEPQKSKYGKALGVQRDLMTELIEGLPEHEHFAQQFHWSVSNWLPFYWRGFRQTTMYTYIVEDLSDLTRVKKEWLENIRRDIKKAQRGLTVRRDLGIETIHRLSAASLDRAGRGASINFETLKRVERACADRGARETFFAEDETGRVHAGIMIVWDKDSAYYLLGGTDPEMRNSGANSLVFWEAIQFAATVAPRFDMEGSMIEPVERFLRGFGARQTPYSSVSRSGRRMRTLQSGADTATALLGDTRALDWARRTFRKGAT